MSPKGTEWDDLERDRMVEVECLRACRWKRFGVGVFIYLGSIAVMTFSLRLRRTAGWVMRRVRASCLEKKGRGEIVER